MTTERAVDDLPLGQIFKLVFVGWACGVVTLFIVPLLLVLLFGSNRLEALLGLGLVPLIALAQGVFAGVIVVLGIAVYRSRPRRAGK